MLLNKLRRKFKVAIRDAVMDAGWDLYRRSPDRKVLQRQILPYFARSADYRRILFVGCDWYTRGYQRLFEQQEYWTLDFDPAKRRYGAARHIVDSMVNIREHFAVESFDAILCNGVFGYGLNDPEQVDRAFRGCHESLRVGGVFVLGWNDVPEHRPFDPADSDGLKPFKPFVFPPLETQRYRVVMRTRHVYDFWVK